MEDKSEAISVGLRYVVNKIEKWRKCGSRILLVDDEPMSRMGLKGLL